MDKHAKRKAQPILTGLIDYFPNACLYVSEVSRVANEQHNAGQPMHWAKEKSIGDGNEILRHLIDRGTLDDDGLRHTGKVAWRALELLERELLSDKCSQCDNDYTALSMDTDTKYYEKHFNRDIVKKLKDI